MSILNTAKIFDTKDSVLRALKLEKVQGTLQI